MRILQAIGGALVQATGQQISDITSSLCGPSGPTGPNSHFSLLEAFTKRFGVPNALNQVNAMSMVRVPSGLRSGTVVTMDASFFMNANRPRSGYRIDLQHYNQQHPTPASRGAANFQIQLNTPVQQANVSIAEVHIPVNTLWTPVIVHQAFTQSLLSCQTMILAV